jgi:FtsH-binding integral membrane protein
MRVRLRQDRARLRTIPEERMTKGFFESLLDFSFREYVTPRSLGIIYGLHLLAGLIAAVVLVANAFRDSTSQGLLMLVISIVGFFFWTLYVRIVLETLEAIFRIADAAAPPERR